MEIIAEIGQNHNGDMGMALELIHAAKEAGADSVKFQVYNAPLLFPRENNPWFDYNCKTELSRDQLGQLREECERVGIEFFASVFDVERISWLEELGVNRYKIASRSITDTYLIQALAKTNKSLLVSLGMWKGVEFPVIPTQAPVSFLYCVSKYPTDLEDLRLGSVDFKRYAGLSDHTLGISAAQAAFSRGAKAVEKHFTLDKDFYGPDHACSMTPIELNQLSEFRNDLKKLL